MERPRIAHRVCALFRAMCGDSDRRRFIFADAFQPHFALLAAKEQFYERVSEARLKHW